MDVADVAAVAKLPEQLAASAAEFADVVRRCRLTIKPELKLESACGFST
jgi:hypothetical protein